MNAADLLSPFSGWLEEENAEVSSSQSHYLKLAPVAITGSSLKNIYNNHVVCSAVSTISSIRRLPTTQPYPISLHSVSSTIALGQWNKNKIFNFFIYQMYVHLLNFSSVWESAVFCCHLCFSPLLCSVWSIEGGAEPLHTQRAEQMIQDHWQQCITVL